MANMSQKGHGPVRLNNPNMKVDDEDVLYHLALNTKDHNLKDMFGDVKFVCVGGSPRRMGLFAKFLVKELRYHLPTGQALTNISEATDRFALYKVGPVLVASHGMGVPSVSILLHEIIKLLFHAEASDVIAIRLGTSGGLGLDAGTVVVTEQALDGLLRPEMELHILGEVVNRPAKLDPDLQEELVRCALADDKFKTVTGKTMCTSDFYEGQARIDGAICESDNKKKLDFLKHCHAKGIRNIEMESLCFAAMCYQANIKGAVACVTILDRLKGDQVDASPDTFKEWDERPANLVARFIKSRLNIKN